MMDQIWTFLLPIISALSFAVVFYLKQLTGENPEPFDPVKLAITAVYGVVLGILSVLMNVPMTEANFASMYAMYIGLVAMIESIVKFFIRAVIKPPVTQKDIILIDEEAIDKLVTALDERGVIKEGESSQK